MYTLSGQNAGLYDTLIILAGLARATERIELVVLVSPITFRHPSVLAERSVTIDHMSGGGCPCLVVKPLGVVFRGFRV